MSDAKLRVPVMMALIFATLVLLFFIVQPFLVVVALAMVCAIILRPLYFKILKRTKGKEALSAWLTLSLAIIGVVIPLVFLGTQLFHEAVQLYGSISEEDSRQRILAVIMQNTGSFFETYIPGIEAKLTSFSSRIDESFKSLLSWFIDNLDVALSGFSRFFIDVLIFLIALYYCIKDGHKLKNILYAVSPLGNDYDQILITKIQSAVNSVIKGNLFIALAQGMVSTLGFLLTGIPNSILWGVLAAVSSLIPRIGTALVILPAVVYLLITGDTLQALFLAVWGVGIVGVIDNILGPKLIAKELELHPLSILLSVVGGLVFFGPAGIFLGPLTVSLFVVFISIYADLNKNK